MHPDKFLGRSPSAQPMYSEEEEFARLAELTKTICERRSDAVEARKSSGIEREWLECEEAHLGIDDMNRHEFADAKWAKPTSMVGPVTSSKVVQDDSKSNVFVRVTSRYVFGASAKLAEILLPLDDKAFKVTPTPDPDLIQQALDQTPATHPDTGLQMMRPAQPGEQPPGLPAAPATQPAPTAPSPQGQTQQQTPPTAPGNGAQPVMPVTQADIAEQIMAAAEEAAEKVEKRIYDWQIECKYPAEIRKVIDDAARCGVGVLKGPFPDIKKSKAVNKENGAVEMIIEEKIIPASKWVDFWNIFPDDACGENIHNGSYIFEREFLSEKQLRALNGQEGYLSDKIDLVIKEGPGKVYSDGGNPNDKKTRKRYEIWYYYGTLTREQMGMLGAPYIDELPDDQEDIHAIVSMVNDTIIRAVINPLDSGNFPYQVMTWSRRPGHWAGVGVAEQMRSAQRMVNAATRALLNNAGLSCGPQIVIDQMGMIPADGSWKLYPNKIWYKTADSVSTSVQDAFYAAIIPSVQQEMQAIIDYAMKLAEESTGIPLITQGQAGPSTPQTFGAAELQDNNAHTWLRSIAARFDDQITEPNIQDYYEWLLLDPEVPDEEKGNFTIEATGSSAMVERAIQEQFYITLLDQVENKDFKLNPEKLMAELLKSKRLDPRKIQFSKEEQEQQAQQPPPPDVRVQVEQIKGQNAMQLQQAEAQSEEQKLQQEMQLQQQQDQAGGAAPHEVAANAKIKESQIRAQSQERIEQMRAENDLKYVQTEAQISRDDNIAELHKMELQRQLLILEYAAKNNMQLSQIHADLMKTGVQEQTKRELKAIDNQASANEQHVQHAHEMNMASRQASAAQTPSAQ